MSSVVIHRARIAAVALAVFGATGLHAAGSDGSPQKAGARSHTVVLTRGQQILIAEEGLALELTDIKDSRCPAGVACIWAGHASVTLQASKAGSPAESVTIGTKAPPSMKLPYEAVYAGYLLHLESLESGTAASAPKSGSGARATVKVSKL